MVELVQINEANWQDVARLSVHEEQRVYLDTPLGIIARGYVYRADNARVIGIAEDGTIIGVALVRNLDEPPACYDLQQFLIGARYQGKGYGAKALALILSMLRKEGKYDAVEVCVNRANTMALRLFEKAGFEDTGYIDENVPDCLNLMHHFSKSGCDQGQYTDKLTSDFTDPLFQAAFRQYFGELGFHINDWDGLFKEMQDEGGNAAFIRTAGDGSIVGFIQFKPIEFTSWFFQEACGFIREFWVSSEYRGKGHGSALLRLAEDYFRGQNIHTAILTTDTAEPFYIKRGYEKAPGLKAKNNDAVYAKRLAE